MFFLIVSSFFAGILLAVSVQFIFFRRWFCSLPYVSPSWKPQTEAFSLPKELNEALRDETAKKQKESCLSLNVVLQFLFQELKDTKRIRRWAMKRMKMEFEEMLRSTTGKLLEHITVRDFNLGKTFPVIKNAAIDNVVVNDDNILEEVSLVLELTYSGRFQLAVDVDMVFGKSAYLSVVLTKLQGTARLQFTRQPYTHWSFAFVEDPLLQLEVESHFEGRPIAQLTSVIVNQIRKSVRKKHTLPSYKIRYRPFFVMPVSESAPQTVYYQGNKLTIGRLEVFVICCSRLSNISPDSCIYCTLALDSIQWMELMSFRHKLWTAHDVEVIRAAGQNIGLSFGEVFLVDKYEEMVVVTCVIPGSPAAKADIQKNDLLVAVNGVKLTNSRQAVRLMKNSSEKILLRVERAIKGFSGGTMPKTVSKARSEDDPTSVRGIQSTSETATDSAFTTIQNGSLDSSEDVSILPVTMDSDRSSLEETSSLKNFDALNSQSSSSAAVTSAANSAPSSPPTAKRGLTQILTTGSGLFQRKKPKSEVATGSTEFVKISKEAVEKCPEVRPPQSKPEVQGSDAQTAPKREKKPSTVEAKVGDFAPQSVPLKEINQSNRNPETQASGADPAETTVRESTRQSSVPVPGLSGTDGATDRAKMRTTHSTKATPNPAFNEKFNFDVQEKHNYLNVCIWNKEPEKLDKQRRVIKPEKDVLLGHISIPLMDIALECLTTLQGDVTNFYNLTPSDSKVETGRPQFANLATHSGFDERLCHGELCLRFQYATESISKRDRSSIISEERDSNLRQSNVNDTLKDLEDFANLCDSSPAVSKMNMQHDFTIVHFQTATYCNFCSKKIWLKTAFQCQLCRTVCHKKCMEKCQAQMKCVKPTERILKKELNKEDKETEANTEDGLLKSEDVQQSEDVDGELVERKRHNSAPDEAVIESAIIDQIDLSGAIGIPRTKSSTSLGDVTIENVVSTAKSLEDTENLSKMFHRMQNSPNSDELVVTQAKRVGKELFASLNLEDRKAKLDSTILRLQGEIDSESEHRAELRARERATTDKKLKKTLQEKMEKSDGKLHSLTVLMLQYCAGLQYCLDQEETERQRQAERDSIEETLTGEQAKAEFPESQSEQTESVSGDAEEQSGIPVRAASEAVSRLLDENGGDDLSIQPVDGEIAEEIATDAVSEAIVGELLDDAQKDRANVVESVEIGVPSLVEHVAMSSDISICQLLDHEDSLNDEEIARLEELIAADSSDSISLIDDVLPLPETIGESIVGAPPAESPIEEESSSLVEVEASSASNRSNSLSLPHSAVELVDTSVIDQIASSECIALNSTASLTSE